MSTLVQIDFPHDTRPLLAEVRQNWRDFYIDTSRRSDLYHLHGQTYSIYICHGNQRYTPNACNFPLIDSTITSLIEEWGGESFKRAIVYLEPNGEVFPHPDAGNHYKDKDRFHLVLFGTYDFTVGGITKTLNEGELWWFDNKKVHSVKNLLDKPRICVIFDVLHGSSWRDKKLLASS